MADESARDTGSPRPSPAAEAERGDSYFEIQLDRGTVALAGLAFAALLVLAFLLGHWWGRTGSDATDPAVAAELEAAAEVPEDDVDRLDEEVVDGRPPFGETPVSARGAPVLAPVPSAPAPGATPPGPGAEEASPSKPSARRSASSGAATSSGWVVQVGAFKARGDAEALQRRLASAGWPVRVASSGSFHKVQVGPFARHDAAVDAEQRLKREERVDTWLHRE